MESRVWGMLNSSFSFVAYFTYLIMRRKRERRIIMELLLKFIQSIVRGVFTLIGICLLLVIVVLVLLLG